jgi:FkbM family methyltransferase
MLKDSIYGIAPFVPNFFGIWNWLNKFSSGKSRFVRLVQFWQTNKDEFIFAGDDYCLLSSLGYRFQTKSIQEDLLELFFKARKFHKFYSLNGKIYMEIGGYKFLLPFPYGVYELLEVFRLNRYGLFDVKDRVVVDIGAFIGDSALYFAGRGAEKIIAFEPVSYLSEIAKQNVRLNHMESKIRVCQKAVATESDVKNIYFNPRDPGGSSMVFDKKDTLKLPVDTISLSAIIQELGNVDLLKLHCEGEEYEILYSAFAEGTLKAVGKIVVNIHGPPEPIVGVLNRAGFNVSKIVKQMLNHYLLFAEKHH